jgi:2-dehydropantoate 2-reductase
MTFGQQLKPTWTAQTAKIDRRRTIRIVILGVGAMGCLFGARLTPHADVTLAGRWPEQIAALRRDPLRIVLNDGREAMVRLHVTDDIRTVGPVDVALIVTKAPKTASAAEGAALVLKPEGVAVTLQNGIGHLDILAGYVGRARAALGVTTLGAAMDGPGRLRYGGPGRTVLATRPEIDAPIRALADLLHCAGLAVEVAEDVSTLAWGKLAVNAAINPLTALLRVPNGALLDSAWARMIMRQAAQEVAAVAAAQGITLPFDDAAAWAEEVARQTAHNRSSMLQDTQRGALTEIEVICGAVIRAADSLGLDTPTNRMLYHLIKALEESYPARI